MAKYVFSGFRQPNHGLSKFEFFLDTGLKTAMLLGYTYELTDAELARVSPYVVMSSEGTSPTTTPFQVFPNSSEVTAIITQARSGLQTDISATANAVDPAVFNVKAPIGIFLGAKGDNSTDDYDALMRTRDAAEAYVSGASYERAAIIKMPMGSYRTRASLKIRVPNITVMGDGSGNPKGSADPSTSPVYGGTVIRPTAGFTDPWVIDFARAENDYALAGNRVVGLSIDGYATGTTYDGNGYLTGGTAIGGIRFRVFSGGMYDVCVTRINGDGYYHEAIDHVTTWPKGAWDCRFDSIRADTVGGNGFHASPGASDSMVILGIFEYTNGHGIYLEGPGYQLFINDTYNCLGNGINALTRAQIIIGNRHIDCNGGLYLWGAVGDGGATIIVGNEYRSCSYSGDGVWDGINIAPTSTVRGINIGPNSFSTLQRNGPANKMRYCINIANANAVDTKISPQSYDFLSPATGCYATAPVNDIGTNTHRHDKLPPSVIRLKAEGLIAQNWDRDQHQNQQLMIGGTAYGMLVDHNEGDPVTNICVQVAAQGTSVTLFKAAIFSADAVTRYVVTANENAQFATAGAKQLPLSPAGPWRAPITTSYLYVFIATATTTLPALFRAGNLGSETKIGTGARPYCTLGTGLSDLPAAGATILLGAPISFWAGAS